MANHCAECVAKAKLRNRDMAGMINKAKQDAIQNKESIAVCWSPQVGLFIARAYNAVSSGFIIRDIVSHLR